MKVWAHIDQPTGFLLFNLGQQVAGWLSAAEAIDARSLRFVADGRPMEVQFYSRPDVEMAMGKQWATGWSFVLDQSTMSDPPSRTLELDICVGDELVHSQRFYRSRHLMPPGRNSPLFFMHIPKSAGTVLRHFIDEAFGGFPSVLIYGDPPGITALHAATTHLAFANTREILFGHFDFDLVRKLQTGNAKVIAVLRDPTQLVRSYLDFHVTPDAPFLDNPLVRHFCGLSYTEPFGLISDHHLDEALQNIEANFLIVQQDRLQEFADQVTQAFGLTRYIVPRTNETIFPVPAKDAPMSVDVRYDTQLYEACRDKSMDFLDFLNA